MITDERLPTRVTEVIPTSTGHVSAALYFFNDLPTATTLPILLCHFKMHSHMNFTFSLMRKRKAFFTVFTMAKLAFHSLRCIERARALWLLAWFKAGISDYLFVAVYFMNFSFKTAWK